MSNVSGITSPHAIADKSEKGGGRSPMNPICPGVLLEPSWAPLGALVARLRPTRRGDNNIEQSRHRGSPLQPRAQGSCKTIRPPHSKEDQRLAARKRGGGRRGDGRGGGEGEG
eukprot:9471739-Pyramimonas_sp.AAC.1